MGISLQQYRCAIGRFCLPPLSSQCSTSSCLGHDSFPSRCLPLIVICLLLLMSGIEPNPGPMRINCKYCTVICSSVAQYCEHVKVHQFRKNFNIPCCFDSCNRNLSTLNSLYSHITRFHSEEKEETCVLSEELACPVATCAEKIQSRKQYLTHMACHLDRNESFTCPFEDCGKIYSVKSKFRTHMSRCHPVESNMPFAYKATTVPDEESTPIISVSPPSSPLNSEHGTGDSDHETTTPISYLNENCYSDDPFPEHVIKNEVARFYLKLEGDFLLPTSTVQDIAEEVTTLSELSHHCLKRALRKELESEGLEKSVIDRVTRATFKKDPVFNMHHKNEDVEQVSTHHLRTKYWKKHFPFVEPREIFLGRDGTGKEKYAHYVSIRDSLNTLLADKKVKNLVLKSMTQNPSSPQDILHDFTSGSAYQKHRLLHADGKCLQLLLFQDAFEISPFGPAKGIFKPVGFYYTLGNIPPEYRSRVDLIQLAYMILEKDLRPSELEDLGDMDKLKAALKPLLDELLDLKQNGITIDGVTYSVCLLFVLGDNLGQHTIGGFIKSFFGHYFCRFCPISKAEFQECPFECPPMRTKEDYDDAVSEARRIWLSMRKQSIHYSTKSGNVTKRKAGQPAKKRLPSLQKQSLSLKKRAIQVKAKTGKVIKRKARRQAWKDKEVAIKIVSASAYKKLCSVNVKGVKYRPSPLNSDKLDFHVCEPSLPPCLAHDLFEGIVKLILARILHYCVHEKQWFDLDTLNRRIKSFKCQGSDAHDAPTPLKSLDELSGNASENWALLRLLVFIIGDLIQDKDDKMWKLYLSMKEICEFVCAPQISRFQLAYLKTLIEFFLSEVKTLENYLSGCITPKLHYLLHYPDLIDIFGPLIRLFTLRYESKHVFFKKVARSCKNYINFTYTLARKYMAAFAFDHSSEILKNDVIPDSACQFDINNVPDAQRTVLPPDVVDGDVEILKSVEVKGIKYKKGLYLLLSSSNGIDLEVGCIDMILLSGSNEVLFVLKKRTALNSFNGFFKIKEPSKEESSKEDQHESFCFLSFKNLMDYYPLPSYRYDNADCLSLKHSVTGMI